MKVEINPSFPRRREPKLDALPKRMQNLDPRLRGDDVQGLSGTTAVLAF
jgi:hypothetical protein